MKQSTLSICMMLLSISMSYGQKTQAFREKSFLKYHPEKGYTDGKGNILQVHVEKKVPVSSFMYYSNNKNKTDSISYYKVDSVDKGKGKPMLVHVTDELCGIKRMLKFKERLSIDVKQEKGKIIIYPWPYVGPDADTVTNKYFTDNEFYIKLEDRFASKISYRAWQYGPLTLPLKVYLASQVQPINNTTFDVNVNFMLGRKWGSNRYYFLPNQAEGTTYEKSFSLNIIAGVGKVELDSSNTTPYITGKYTLPTFSSGLAFGLHYKKVGVFIATGIDTPMGPNSSNWNFAKMPWLGFGLGLGID